MSRDAEPPFRAVGVVGLGLIGGSIALGLRRRWPSVQVLGIDVPEVSAAARRLEAITGERERLEDLQDADLVVLAAPVPQIATLLEAARRAGLRGTITDVGSTKRQIMAAAARGPVSFVGGHPVAGSAQRGVAHARADLFEQREWLVVPGRADEGAVQRVEALARGLGARPRRLDADTHDRLMAYVSHLPQILATALMTTAGHAVGAEGLAAAGPGFADMTRLASSPAELWRGIIASNADFIAEALLALVASLPASASACEDAGRVEALFRAANEWAART
jgi:prephenate dehydrogenase